MNSEGCFARSCGLSNGPFASTYAAPANRNQGAGVSVRCTRVESWEVNGVPTTYPRRAHQAPESSQLADIAGFWLGAFFRRSVSFRTCCKGVRAPHDDAERARTTNSTVKIRKTSA